MLHKKAVLLLFLVIAIVSSVAVSVTFARKWKSNDGKYSVDAEFLDFKDGKVSLRKLNGNVIKVPITRMCDEDQAYVTKRSAASNSAPAITTAAKSPPIGKQTFAQLVQSANHSNKATEVLRLYKRFLQDKSITEADRKAAESQLLTWEERANKKMLRVGLRWLTPTEANDHNLQAQQLIIEAIRLIKAGKLNEAIPKCKKASRIDEDNIQADFLLGLGYAILGHDAKKARSHFAECVRRDPLHVSALNNLALSEVRLERYSKALSHWQTAMEVDSATHEVIQNMGRLLHLSKQSRLNVPSKAQRRLSDLYAVATASADSNKFNRHTGWLYMGYYSPFGKHNIISKDAEYPKAISRDRLIKTGCGMGFVIHAEYILTNCHVVKGSAGLLVAMPGGKTYNLPASVIGVADDDFVVIHCKGLTAPPVRFINTDFAPLGTEIMILGFSDMLPGKTPSLTSTRGTVSGTPDESYIDYKLDAVANPENSGGLICDATGNVLAIFAGVKSSAALLAKDHAIGVPHSRALPLFKNWIPSYKQLPPNTDTKEWDDVNELLSRSAVLIWTQSVISNCGISTLEDCWCMVCCGRGYLDCSNRNCIKGAVREKRWKVVAVDPGTGYQVTRRESFLVKCKTCDGKGVVTCPYCNKGIDKSLR